MLAGDPDGASNAPPAASWQSLNAGNPDATPSAQANPVARASPGVAATDGDPI